MRLLSPDVRIKDLGGFIVGTYIRQHLLRMICFHSVSGEGWTFLPVK